MNIEEFVQSIDASDEDKALAMEALIDARRSVYKAEKYLGITEIPNTTDEVYFSISVLYEQLNLQLNQKKE